MINVATINAALLAMLEADANIDFLSNAISRGEYVNTDPTDAPWLGLYRTKIAYDPRTLGRGARTWQGIVSIKLIVQAVSFDSGSACEDDLEGYVQKLLTALLEDRTISGNVDMLNQMEVDYSYIETDRESVYFQNAIITLQYEVATS